MNIEEVLNATLRRWRTTPFGWTHASCLMSVADYARDCTGIDPAADYRDAIADEAHARRIVADAGGVGLLFAARMMAAGFRSVLNPARGDAVAARVGCAEGAGICTGDMVAFRTDGAGVVELRLGLIAVTGAFRLC